VESDDKKTNTVGVLHVRVRIRLQKSRRKRKTPIRDRMMQRRAPFLVLGIDRTVTGADLQASQKSGIIVRDDQPNESHRKRENGTSELKEELEGSVVEHPVSQ
jgi:hypothetical protein